MIEKFQSLIGKQREFIYALLRRYQSLGKEILLLSDLRDACRDFCVEHGQSDAEIMPIIRGIQEASSGGDWFYMAFRPNVARWRFARIHVENMVLESIAAADYLQFKERLINGHQAVELLPLEIDFVPFSREFPRLQESRSIGHGVSFLNKRLSSQLFTRLDEPDNPLLRFLRLHQYQGKLLMLNEQISRVSELRSALRQAQEILADKPPDTPWAEFESEFRALGFEPGWGRDAELISDSMALLTDVLEAPDPTTLEHFLARIPMIFRLAIISPHGYFGQSGVLGKPDTGGQVVYILDQVRAIEHEMRQRLHQQGLDIQPEILVVTRLLPDAEGTTCNQRLEPISGTRNARILRLPFRNEAGEIVRHWISRFEIWPYLEAFAAEAEAEIIAELGDRPDMIIGNYSDGNLVASLLSQRLGVTQCAIAHALEKSKYILSDLYWQQMEAQYHFSCQYTADLIAMNSSDFIITSTYQEIAGTDDSLGQYEGYQHFTMPGLYRVLNGIDVFDPKFNIVSPGADANVYFPYSDEARRLTHIHDELDGLLQGVRDDARGGFAEPDKPLLFTMARLDRVKNITGLVEWYGQSDRLRRKANLLVIAGHVNPDASLDVEEREQTQRMHALFDQYGLDGQARWLGVQLDKNMAGELYRRIADLRGAFVQPALFEAFGLTVIEAMSSGLPTFATCYGGPLEIIRDGTSGFHINPNHGAQAAEKMAAFFERCEMDPEYWLSISGAALQRINERYTWQHYAERMMTLSRVYGFWKYVTNLERTETRRYLEMFYHLQYRPLAQRIRLQE